MPAPFAGRAVNLVNGFSGVAAEEGFTVILGFGVDPTPCEVAVSGSEVAPLPSDCSSLAGFEGPDNFPIRRSRIFTIACKPHFKISESIILPAPSSPRQEPQVDLAAVVAARYP